MGVNHPQLVGLLLGFPHYMPTYRNPNLQRRCCPAPHGLTDPAASLAGPAAHGAGPIQNDPGQTPLRRRWPVGSSDRLPDRKEMDSCFKTWQDGGGMRRILLGIMGGNGREIHII